MSKKHDFDGACLKTWYFYDTFWSFYNTMVLFCQFIDILPWYYKNILCKHYVMRSFIQYGI